MKDGFNSHEFVKALSQELITNFNKAGTATTPTTVGVAREKAVRDKLEQLLPGLINVGTGFVIDSFGHTSKQTDIVLLEKEICPIFSINDTPETTFYPCESVLAVGEIKSTLDANDIIDSFQKIESVKKAKRYCDDSIHWRKYCSTVTMLGAEIERFSQEKNPYDQIFGFILCGKIELSIDTFLEKCKQEIASREKHLLPNMIMSLENGFASFYNKRNNQLLLDAHEADSFTFFNETDGCFQLLLDRLHSVIIRGRTSAITPFHRYVLSKNEVGLDKMYSILI